MRVLPALIGVVLLASACGIHQPVSVSLGSLAANQGSYQGQEVRTEGLVQRFTDPTGPYFVLEDAQQDRVEVLPAARMAGFEGRRVEVTGKFGVNETIGRYIQVERVSSPG